MSHVIIYTKVGNTCPHCVAAKRTLEQHKIAYTEHIIGTPGNTKEDVQKKVNALGHTNVVSTVPQVFYIDNTGKTTYIGGNTELQAKKSILGT